MKKGVLALAIAVVLVCAMVYTRPMTLGELCGGVDLSECEGIKGYYFIAPSVGDSPFEVSEEDAGFGEMLELFSERKFRRSIGSLLPQGTKAHRYIDGDIRWEVSFMFRELEFSDGSLNTGDIITVSNFFGSLEVRFNGKGWRCGTEDKQQWIGEVAAAIQDILP